MDVNLSALQDAGAGSYSSIGRQGNLSVVSAPEIVKPAEDAKAKTTSDTASNSGQSRQKELSKEELQNVAADLTKFMQSINTEISFSIHEKTGRMMVQVKDAKGAVVKEFPSHELLDTIAAIGDYVGALLDKKA
jgi:flagellar protein FlaG